MRIFLESGHGLFFMGLAFALGLWMKGAVSFRYRRLTKGAQNLSDCRQKQLKQLKTRFENTYHLGGDVPYLEAFVESCLHQFRVLGLRAAWVNRLGGQAFFVSVCLGAFLAAASFVYGLERNWTLLYGGTTLGLLILGIFCTGLLGNGEKRAYLGAVLKDQLGNVWRARMREAKSVKEKKEEKRGQEIAYLKQSLDRIAAGKEEGAGEMAEPVSFTDSEKEAFEEILKEYFS